MASEILVNATLQYSDSEGTSDSCQVTALVASVATKLIARHKQAVGFASAVALNLGTVTTPRWVMVKNLDATNYVNVLTGTGGVIFAKLLPGEFCLIPLGSGALAPFIQAAIAACQVEVLVCSL